MIDLIEDNRNAIANLCRQYGIKRLAVFGSAVKGTFDPATSDLDFVVDLGEYEKGVSRRFLTFYTELQNLFDHRVDIETLHPHLSEAFRQELDSTAVTIYG